MSDLRPFLRRAARTRRPLAVCIRRRKPCLLILFLLWGWNVLFIVFYAVLLFIFGITISPQSTRAYGFSACKVRNYFYNSQNSLVIISKIGLWEGVKGCGSPWKAPRATPNDSNPSNLYSLPLSSSFQVSQKPNVTSKFGQMPQAPLSRYTMYRTLLVWLRGME